MAEYVERAALEDALNKRLAYLFKENGEFDHYTNGYDEAVDTVENFPPADVTPVVHGWWVYHNDIDFWQCSLCGVNAPICGKLIQLKTNYCPNCGARMDRGADNAID